MATTGPDPAVRPDPHEAPESALDEAAENALGGELLGALDPLLLVESLTRTVGPGDLARAAGNLARQVPSLLWGQGSDEEPPSDTRFLDPTFANNAFYRRLALGYIAWEQEMMKLVENPDVDWRTRERSRFLMGVITTSLAPTNTLPGNPEAIKLAFTTGGRSLLAGLANFGRDLVENGGLPSQVDTSAFEIGVNLATSPGWVIHRTEMFELIHYTPSAERVGRLPLVLLPPPVNKYYFWDLAPGRSLIEYAVGRGVDVYTIVWRDPRSDNGDWGIDAYLASTLEALKIVAKLSGQDQAHVFGDCSGGMFLSMLLGYEAVTGSSRIRSGTLGVTVADFGEPGGIGMAASDHGLKRLRARAKNKEVISAASLSSTFVWMRPNDLVWRYLVDEWLLGKKPPAFDIMYWNADGQGMPAQLAYELTLMNLENSLIEPGGMTVLGTAIDLSRVSAPTYQIAGTTDHISPWKGCYAAARVLGGENTFVLTPTGHVQSIIYPMGKRRAAFHTRPDIIEDPDEWLAGATRREDSWWEHWVDWLLERSDGTRPAPPQHGNATYHRIVPAPGRYVRGE